jgi:predicted  nucleic acid-binding Zn-ribbon protein
MTKASYATNGDIKLLKGDINHLKSDVKDLRGDVKDLKGDVNFLKDYVKSLREEVKIIVLESEERIMTELKDMREEFSAHQFSHMRINDDLEEHDRRLKKLELAVV